MAILAGDIKLLSSKVMLDVPEGGGGPTSTVIPDGVSNAVFPDISELDRTNGRVNARQLHVTVQSNDTATFLGSNIIVAEPPNDPNVSITLFSTGDSFDKRTSAVARIEAYLSVGPTYAGFLFGNHIAGQRTMLLFQRGSGLPAIGDTLVLIKRQGYSDEYKQYVRVTDASVSLRTFTDQDGDFDRNVATISLSDALRVDFVGYDVSRIDIGKDALALGTKITETIVADAARYYGVVPSVNAAVIGDFSIKGASIFTQLVPSAQIETPVADARVNQVTAAVVASGGQIVQTIATPFDNTRQTNIFIGGGITRGSLTIVDVNGTVSPITDDKTGRLLIGTTQVGTVDYANGILTPLAAIHNGSVPLRFTYTPAAVPDSIGQSQGFEVTQANRSLNFVRTIEPTPVAASLIIDYRSQGRWYRLQDDGSGAIRGLDSSFGAGSLNQTSGTISVTLGALPDVGSSIIFQWVIPQAQRDNSELQLDNNGKLFWPLNTSGSATLTPGEKSLAPSHVTLTWLLSGVTKTATDDGYGVLIGDATGSVDYANGVLKISPTILPAPGTTFTLVSRGATPTPQNLTLGTSGAYRTIVLGPTSPGSVNLQITGQRKFSYQGGATLDWAEAQTYQIFDTFLSPSATTGILALRIGSSITEVGTITYATGACQIATSTTLSTPAKIEAGKFDNVYQRFNNYNVLGVRAA